VVRLERGCRSHFSPSSSKIGTQSSSHTEKRAFHSLRDLRCECTCHTGFVGFHFTFSSCVDQRCSIFHLYLMLIHKPSAHLEFTELICKFNILYTCIGFMYKIYKLTIFFNPSDSWSLPDGIYNLFPYMVCNDVEILMYTLCASVTVLAPLLTHSKNSENTPHPFQKSGDNSISGIPNPLSSEASSKRDFGTRQSGIPGWSLAMSDSDESVAQLNVRTVNSRIQTIEEFEITTQTRPSDADNRPRTLSHHATRRTSYDDVVSLHSVAQSQMV